MWRYVDNDTNLARTGSSLSSLSSWWSNRNHHILWRNGNAVVVGWMVSLQKIRPPPNPRTCECDLWKLSLPMTLSMLRWYHAGYPVGPKTNSKCHIYETHRGDDVKVEAETGALWLQARKRQKWLAAIRSSREAWHERVPSPANSAILDFQPPELWENKFLFFLIYFLLKDDCFTEFCCFLSNLNMNRP